ncbi:Uncharacterised protein [Campylobacter jejuni subsp. doylei]|nr:Uncharacterised protein [Campylobacter jejuni subsp. doylei]
MTIFRKKICKLIKKRYNCVLKLEKGINMKQGDFTEVAKHYHNYNQACMEYGVRFTLLLENKIFVFLVFCNT